MCRPNFPSCPDLGASQLQPWDNKLPHVFPVRTKVESFLSSVTSGVTLQSAVRLQFVHAIKDTQQIIVKVFTVCGSKGFREACTMVYTMLHRGT